MAKYNSLDDNNPVKQTIEKVRLTFMEALKKNIEKGALYAGAMFLGTLMLYNSGVYAEAASASALAKTNYSVEMTQPDTVTVKLKLNTKKKVKITKVSGIKSIKSTQSGKTVTVKIKVSKAGTYKLKVSGFGMKTSTAKIKVIKAAKADHNITSTVNVAGYSIGLGMSTSQVESALASYGAPVYKGSGCQSYDTECWYYQKNGSQTSFMIEFYKGAVERILFSSPKWSNGGLSQDSRMSKQEMDCTIANRGEDDEVYAYSYSESKGNCVFTMYQDNNDFWGKNGDGWYLCELKDSSVSHSGKNTLAGKTKTISFDLSKYEVGSEFEGKKSDLPKNKAVSECSKADLLELEKGRQMVYLYNMYRTYHNEELAAYSDYTSEFAYVNAKVRSLLEYSDHIGYFDGTFRDNAIRKTANSVRVNEWLVWDQNYGENVSYHAEDSALADVVGCISSSSHLETMMYGNFAMGAAVVDGYSTLEVLSCGHKSEEKIKDEQQRFVKDYDIGLTADEVPAALARDAWNVYTYSYLYELMDGKEAWVKYVTEKCNFQDVRCGQEYLEMVYDNFTSSLCKYIYGGKESFWQVYEPWLEKDFISASQLEEVYLHFCALEYDQEYTQALMNHFGCSEKEVYLEHSDILVELGDATGSLAEQAAVIKAVSDKNAIPLRPAIKMYTKSITSVSADDQARLEHMLYDHFGIN